MPRGAPSEVHTVGVSGFRLGRGHRFDRGGLRGYLGAVSGCCCLGCRRGCGVRRDVRSRCTRCRSRYRTRCRSRSHCCGTRRRSATRDALRCDRHCRRGANGRRSGCRRDRRCGGRNRSGGFRVRCDRDGSRYGGHGLRIGRRLRAPDGAGIKRIMRRRRSIRRRCAAHGICIGKSLRGGARPGESGRVDGQHRS